MKTISPGGGRFRQRNYRNPLEVVPEQTVGTGDGIRTRT